MTVKVGDKVAIYGFPATVKYVGTFPPVKKGPHGSAHISGPVVGVEFHKRGLGNCDGTYHGHRYFQCTPGMGRFVRAFSVKPFSSKIKHAYRGSLCISSIATPANSRHAAPSPILVACTVALIVEVITQL